MRHDRYPTGPEVGWSQQEFRSTTISYFATDNPLPPLPHSVRTAFSSCRTAYDQAACNRRGLDDRSLLQKCWRTSARPLRANTRTRTGLVLEPADPAEELVSTIEPCRDRQRHRRKYAEGELSKDESFYFRGPDAALNLRAQNLILFVQLAEGVDDRTWTHHLHPGDYSHWLREQVKDDELADEVSNIEGDERLSPAQSRSQIKEAIARRYTGPT